MTTIPATQRAAVYYRNADIRIEERPVPKIGPGELLLKVRASGICGSDVLEWYRIKKAPIVLGHEVAGEIAAVGDGITKYKVGQRVAVSHHVPCNTCHYCLAGHHTACHTLHTTNFDPGGFAEYVRVPALQADRGVFAAADNVSFEEGSFFEPLGCVVRGQRSADLRPGQTVAVFGAGISGILHIALAKALGAGRIVATDISAARLAMARHFGADEAFDARDGRAGPASASANGGRGADLVVVCAGALARLQAGPGLGRCRRHDPVLRHDRSRRGTARAPQRVLAQRRDPEALLRQLAATTRKVALDLIAVAAGAGGRHDHAPPAAGGDAEGFRLMPRRGAST